MTLVFDEMLELITDRSAALRDAVVAAGDIEARVPGWPDWALRDLVTHMSQVQRSWAQVVRAGDTEVEWVEDGPPETATLIALLASHPRNPRPITTLDSTPESTPATRNEVRMKPGNASSPQHFLEVGYAWTFVIHVIEYGGKPQLPQESLDSVGHG